MGPPGPNGEPGMAYRGQGLLKHIKNCILAQFYCEIIDYITVKV